MNRTLAFVPFAAIFAAISLMLLICFINIYILARHRRSFFTLCLHLCSFFGLCGLFFYLMSAAVFVLPLSRTYIALSQASFILLGIGIAAGGVILAQSGRRSRHDSLSPNIGQALSGIDSIVFVADADGTVTQLNHPDLFEELFGDIRTLDELSGLTGIGIPAGDTEDVRAFSIGEDRDLVCSIYPIIHKKHCLGHTVIIEDVSDIRRGERILRERNEYLAGANEKLSGYIKVAGALEEERERLSILEHVQSTLIGDMERALSSIRRIKQDFSDERYGDEIGSLASLLRGVYDEVRRAVGRIAGKESRE
ncbi:MAG: hypothetical protein AB9835_09680 [Eubacteriales bacterium]